jgi:hypothetical protein
MRCGSFCSAASKRSIGYPIQVVDLHDESLVWLLPYAEVQKLGFAFTVSPPNE